MKIIFVASVFRHLTSFHIPYMLDLKKRGYEVYAAGFDENHYKKILLEKGIHCIDVPFSRKLFSLKHIKSYKILKQISQTTNFKAVHVHTPIAAFLTRIAFRNSFSKVIYTAHGFHFYKGAPIKNWITYYPIEKIAARWTYKILTINKEDYKRALRMNYGDENVHFVHGVGVETLSTNIRELNFKDYKKSLFLKEDSLVVSYVAELNKNKNHIFLLRNWSEIKKKIPTLTLLVIGEGPLRNEMERYIERNELKDIIMLGQRDDVEKILSISNIVCLFSYREGLPRSIQEAMSQGIPCIVSNTRGLNDLIQDKKNGFVINIGDDLDLIASFEQVLNDPLLYKLMSANAKNLIKPYMLENVITEYRAIYKSL